MSPERAPTEQPAPPVLWLIENPCSLVDRLAHIPAEALALLPTDPSRARAIVNLIAHSTNSRMANISAGEDPYAHSRKFNELYDQLKAADVSKYDAIYAMMQTT